MTKSGGSYLRGLIWAATLCLLAAGQTARADFVFGEATKVPNINDDSADDSEPQISRDGLELYFLSDRADDDGESSDNLWVARRASPRDPWSAPVKLDAPVNTTGTENSPSLSADGLELYFSNGYADLWVSTRPSKSAPWGEPVKLPAPVNSENAEDTPCISADGLSLYFMSDRPGGDTNPTNSDIFVTTRLTRDAPWGEPVKLGPNVNGEEYEFTPFVSSDGLSLFFARGYSKAHIHVCRRRTTSEAWGPAEFFAPVNSGTNIWHDMPGSAEWNLSFSAEDPTLYFARATDLFSTDFDIWQVTVTPIVDFNADGVVDVLDVVVISENWGIVGGRDGPPTSLCDIAPFPFGDGVVDAKDLLILAEYMIEADGL